PDYAQPEEDLARLWLESQHGLDWANALEAELMNQEGGEACKFSDVCEEAWLDDLMQAESARNLIVAALSGKDANLLRVLSIALIADAKDSIDILTKERFRKAFENWSENNEKI